VVAAPLVFIVILNAHRAGLVVIITAVTGGAGAPAAPAPGSGAAPRASGRPPLKATPW